MRQVALIVVLLSSGMLHAQHWHPLPEVDVTISMSGKDMLVWNDTLYVSQVSFDGVYSWVAAWDSLEWSPVGNPEPFFGSLACMEIYRDTLYTMGSFIEAGVGDNVTDVGKLNNGIWEGAGITETNGGSAEVRQSEVYHDTLWLCDNITTMAEYTAWNIIANDGNGWVDVPGINSPCVEDLHTFRDTLLACGWLFYNEEGEDVSNVAYWNGQTWKSYFDHDVVGGLAAPRGIYTDSLHDCLVFRHSSDGAFLPDGGYLHSPRLIKYTDNGFESMTNYTFGEEWIRSTCQYRGQWYATGITEVYDANGDTIHMNNFMVHDGIEWQPAGGGMNTSAKSMCVYKDELYIAGNITYVGGIDSIAVPKIVRWYVHPDSVVWGVHPNAPGEATGIDELKSKTILNVFPNPSSSQFTVELASGKHGYLLLTDVHGREVLREPLEGKTKVVLPVNGLPAGHYFVSVLVHGIIEESVRVVVK